MSTYTAIADAEIDVDSPVTQVLLTKYRENMLAIQQGDATAPKVALPAIVDALSAISTGAVASYAFLREPSRVAPKPERVAGSTVAGSLLRYSNASGSLVGGTPAGTWRLMGYFPQGSGSSDQDATTLMLRIA